MTSPRCFPPASTAERACSPPRHHLGALVVPVWRSRARDVAAVLPFRVDCGARVLSPPPVPLRACGRCVAFVRPSRARDVAAVLLSHVDRAARVLSPPPPPRRACGPCVAFVRPSRARRVPAVRRVAGLVLCPPSSSTRACSTTPSASTRSSCLFGAQTPLACPPSIGLPPSSSTRSSSAAALLYALILTRWHTLRAHPHPLAYSTRSSSLTGLLYAILLPVWCRVTSPLRAPPLRAPSRRSEFRLADFLPASW